MRIESSVTAISWIPSEAIDGMPKLPFELGVAHYDAPPPETLAEGDLERLRDEDRYREANRLAAWIEVTDGTIDGYGYSGEGFVGSTTFKLGGRSLRIPGVAFDLLQAEPKVSEDAVRFVQTVGGRAGFPAPRRVRGRPFMRVHSSTAWTTLALTIHADGTAEYELTGASSFPRHWIYDADGRLAQKSGTVDFATWYREAHGERTPWGEEDSPAFVTQAESALERQISRWLMQSVDAPERRRLAEGETLVEQGDAETDLYLLLDGVLAVEVDGEEVAEIGPGAVLGERSQLDGGRRTATLRARTACRVAVVPGELLDRRSLEQLSEGRAAGLRAAG
jgi:hypothetical protein